LPPSSRLERCLLYIYFAHGAEPPYRESHTMSRAPSTHQKGEVTPSLLTARRVYIDTGESSGRENLRSLKKNGVEQLPGVGTISKVSSTTRRNGGRHRCSPPLHTRTQRQRERQELYGADNITKSLLAPYPTRDRR